MVSENINHNKLVYVAGFFDGEGSIYICKSGNKKQYFLCVNLANTNYTILKWINKDLKGKINLSKDNRVTNHKQMYRLRWYSQEAKEFLKKIFPYLKIKKAKATLAIEFQSQLTQGTQTLSYKKQAEYKEKIKHS